jgi:uncharacterized protein YoxC
MLWQISVAIIAIAFGVLVYFLVRTLTAVQTSLKETNETIVQIQGTLDDVTTEVKGLIRNTNQITLDVRNKMKALDSLFGTVENVGDTLEGVTSSLRSASASFMSNVKTNIQTTEQPSKKVYKVLNLAGSVYDIWQRIKIARMTNRETARH